MNVSPRLLVRGADRAIAFYRDALGAELLEHFADPNLGGLVVHAALRIGDSTVSLADESLDFGNLSPEHLGGSAVILNLDVDDADAVGARMLAGGATVVIPIEDRFYGRREGRLRDPFGHLWIISQTLEELDHATVMERMQAAFPGE